jgi:hypothetical protein
VTEAELTARRMRASLDSASDPNAALVNFVGSLPPRQTRQLRALLGEAQKRRR